MEGPRDDAGRERGAPPGGSAPTTGEWWLGLAEAAHDALALVLPVACAGCGADGRDLCADCRPALAPSTPRVRRVDGLPVWSALDYRDVPRRVLLAAKDAGRPELLAAFAPALAHTVSAAVGASSALLVPVPPSRAGARRRGVDPVRLALRCAGLPALAELTRGRDGGEQKGLGVAERARNRAGAFRVRRVPPGVPLLVVDDVVTTGATVLAAASALRDAGGTVVGAVTIAATPRYRPFAADADDADPVVHSAGSRAPLGGSGRSSRDNPSIRGLR